MKVMVLKLSKQLSFSCFWLGIFMSLTSLAGAQETGNTKHRPKVAVVLSGGGAKGFAHIGVLKVLEEEGIPIDLIVGTSMGSLVGGIYSIGYSAAEIEDIVKKQNWELILSDDVPRLFLSKNDQAIKQRYFFSLTFTDEKSLGLPQGLIKGQNVLNTFCGLAANVPANADFTKFPIPFACVAANLENGNEVVMTNGFLPTAMFSSMAIPGVFQPSERNGLFLVDGGVVNNFPTDVAKKMGADIVIGVDIRDGFCEKSKLKSMSEVIGQLINFLGQEKDSINNSICNLIISPDITGYSAASFSTEAADTLILRGEKAASTLREQIRKLKIDNKLEPREKSRSLVINRKWKITDLHFNENHGLNDVFIRKTLNMQIPGNYSYDEIKDAINRLYGYGGFDKIYFDLADNNEGKTLNLNIIPQKVFSQNIGFRVNTTDAAALLLNMTIKNYGKVFGLLSTSAELSANPGISIIAETSKMNSPAIGIELKGKHQNYNIFENGEKTFDADIFYASGALYIYQSFMKQCTIGLGIQEEYFNGDVFFRNSDIPLSSKQTKNWMTNAYTYFSLDNMDNFYFPQKGTNLYAEFSLSSDSEKISKISPSLLFRMKNVIPLCTKTVLLVDFYNRSLFSNNFPLTKSTLIGGDVYSQYFNYHFPFIGLPPVALGDQFVYIGLIGVRYQLSGSQYLSLVFNSLQQGNKFLDWKSSSASYGGGIKYSLKTAVGPVDIGIGYSDSNDKPTFSANFGYWF